MKILIAANDIKNAYVASLAEAYKRAGCEVVIGVENFYLSNYHPDILHLQWPENLYRSDYSLFGEPNEAIPRLIKQYKVRGAAVVYSAHNLRPHMPFDASIENDIYQSIIAMSDIIVHHGKKSVDLLSVEFSAVAEKKNIICPHGDYLIQYESIPKMRAREYLGLPSDRFILLYFGNIKEYKGFGILKQIYGRWKRQKKYLLAAGAYRPYSSNGLLVRLFTKVHGNWLCWRGNPFMSERRYDLWGIKTADIAYYFSAADAIILTHTSGLTSGILAMAATFKKPVVYPDIGNFSEQMQDWTAESYTVNNTDAAVEALQRLVSRLDKGCSLNNSTWLAKNSWAEHVERILSAVQNLRKA